MADLNELKGLVEKVNEALAPLRQEVDELKSRPRDVVTEDKFDKMANQVTDAVAKLQAIEAKNAALEAAMSRGDMGNDADTKAAEAKARVALNDFLRKDSDKRQLEVRAMSTDSQPDGGYLVMPELSATVVSRIFETSPIRLVANVEQTGAKSRTFLIDDDEGTAEWTGEKVAATEDTPDVGEKEIVAHNVRVKMNATADVLADAYVDLAGWLTGKGADKIARTENTAFFTGNGVNKPRGLLTYANWASPGVYQRDRIEQIISGAATTVTADGFIDLQGSLKEAYQASAVFLMQRKTFTAALKLKGADNYFFSPVLLRNGEASMQILGKRVIFCDDMQAIGSGGNLAVAYGDFGRSYTILDRVGLQILRDPYTAHPYTIFHLTKRTGGDITNFDGVKLMRLAAS